MRKIGLFGSSFNPLHVGHLIISEQSRIRLNLDKIIFIPTHNPYHKKVDLMDFEHRYNMTKISIENNEYFEISDIEKTIEGNSYSYDIVNLIKEQEEADYYFIIGSDSLLQLDTWYRYKDLLNLVNLIIFKRPGYDIPKNLLEQYRKLSTKEIIFYDDLQLEISSTNIRDSIKRGIYPRYILLDDTIEYIKENKLWR